LFLPGDFSLATLMRVRPRVTPDAGDHRTRDAIENDQAILFVLHLVAFDDEDRRIELRHLNLVRPFEPAIFRTTEPEN
jgi:hypothetical protein